MKTLDTIEDLRTSLSAHYAAGIDLQLTLSPAASRDIARALDPDRMAATAMLYVRKQREEVLAIELANLKVRLAAHGAVLRTQMNAYLLVATWWGMANVALWWWS